MCIIGCKYKLTDLGANTISTNEKCRKYINIDILTPALIHQILVTKCNLLIYTKTQEMKARI